MALYTYNALTSRHDYVRNSLYIDRVIGAPIESPDMCPIIDTVVGAIAYKLLLLLRYHGLLTMDEAITVGG